MCSVAACVFICFHLQKKIYLSFRSYGDYHGISQWSLIELPAFHQHIVFSGGLCVYMFSSPEKKIYLSFRWYGDYHGIWQWSLIELPAFHQHIVFSCPVAACVLFSQNISHLFSTQRSGGTINNAIIYWFNPFREKELWSCTVMILYCICIITRRI